MTTIPQAETFDYIIVGAGSAGCVLANRLSASGEHRVLLLEAGGNDRSPWIQVPIGYGRTFNDPRFNWMYQAQPDPALDNRSAFWPRGKVIPGLYACGDSAGGLGQHGICRAATFGRIAGVHAANQQS